jgi:AraC-like DNA-binding protein
MLFLAWYCVFASMIFCEEEILDERKLLPPPPPDVETNIAPNINRVIFWKCDQSWQLKKAKIPFWNITYLIKGSAQYTIDGIDYSLAKGDLVCLSPGHIWAANTRADNPMNCYAVDFFLKNFSGRTTQLPFPLINHIGLKKDIIHLFQELNITWIDRQPGYNIKVQALFFLILHRLFELIVCNSDSLTADFRIKKATRYITAHYTEKISVKDMAAMTGLSIVYFGALFKRETGMTMNQYLVGTRLKKAEEMLRSGKYKVREVAEHCGYNDFLYFYKQFKQVYGISPSHCIPKKSEYC